jgi:aminoglycoside 6'-N-acetyltransferase
MNSKVVSFRSLEESDLDMLHKWMNLPHMRDHYQKTLISLEDLHSKYLPRLASSHPTHCHVASIDSVDVGQFQCYRLLDYKDFSSEVGLEDGVCVDLFIGNTSYLGKGYGKTLLQTYVSDIVSKIFSEEKRCYICHEDTNIAAIKCSLGAGFQIIKNISENGVPSVVLGYDLKVS